MNAHSGFFVMGARTGFWIALAAVCVFAWVALLGQIAEAIGGAV